MLNLISKQELTWIAAGARWKLVILMYLVVMYLRWVHNRLRWSQCLLDILHVNALGLSHSVCFNLITLLLGNEYGRILIKQSRKLFDIHLIIYRLLRYWLLNWLSRWCLVCFSLSLWLDLGLWLGLLCLLSLFLSSLLLSSFGISLLSSLLTIIFTFALSHKLFKFS